MIRYNHCRNVGVFAVTAALALLAPSAFAQTMFLQNFENAATDPNGYSYGAATGRTDLNLAGIGNGDSRGAELRGTFNPGPEGFAGIALQAFEASTATGVTDLSRIFLQLDIRASSTASVGTSFVAIIQSFNGGLTGEIRTNINFTTPATFAQIMVPLTGFSATGNYNPNDPFQQVAIEIGTGNGFQQNPSATHTVVVDNIRMFATPAVVPETGTLALLAAGFAPLGFLAHRRNAK